MPLHCPARYVRGWPPRYLTPSRHDSTKAIEAGAGAVAFSPLTGVASVPSTIPPAPSFHCMTVCEVAALPSPPGDHRSLKSPMKAAARPFTSVPVGGLAPVVESQNVFTHV